MQQLSRGEAKPMIPRRNFIYGLAAGAAIGSTAKSYAQILGSNERLNFAIVGTHSRGLAHLSGLKANAATSHVSHICDVDSNVLRNYSAKAEKVLGYQPTEEADFRRVLESRDVDAITIATPDHWHAPMAILALQAGKHVYVEKPSSHNPREGELLVQAQKRYGKLVQVGNQHRSCAHEMEMVHKIHDGLIGRTYYAKAWYANTRGSMGTGKVVPVPSGLNWDLWQGPVPRAPYKDNIHPYNWHWLRRYGTGEALNNGTHEVDVCRWALGVDYPEHIVAQGGRYHFKDDWEFYDTLVATFAYSEKTIAWEGKSCQGMKCYGRDRGALIQGTEGSAILALDGYEVYDLQGKLKDEFKLGKPRASSDLIGQDEMTNAHFANLIGAIRTGEPLHSGVADINISITTLQLANISWIVNRELSIDPKSGHISDPEALTMWTRSYEPGWEVKV